MTLARHAPQHNRYDVVIIGGAMMGSSTAWFLSGNPDFKGRILVVERDPTYQNAATSHTNSCMRQQFNVTLNIRISQFAADFVKNFRAYMGGGEDIPQLAIHNFGYLYLADTPAFADHLRASHALQRAAGAGTKLMTAEEIKRDYPFYNVDDILLGSHNSIDEGYWDSGTIFDAWRRSAKARGVESIANEVVAITKNTAGTRVESVTLKSGEVIACGFVVNASGTRGSHTAKMVGIDIPVEPRKRYTYVFAAAQPLDRDLPLTIDPSGVHVRQDGKETYMAGGHEDIDPAVDPDDFTMDHGLWENKIWPALATRIPQFEAIKVINSWVGHYDTNTLDHNAIVGPHPEIENFLFLNGFSGHGLQQSPALGRGTAEWITYGGYRTLDLSPFHYERILANRPLEETAII